MLSIWWSGEKTRGPRAFEEHGGILAAESCIPDQLEESLGKPTRLPYIWEPK
jgi:hypothetical protein